MSSSLVFTADQARALRESQRAGEAPVCPVCDSAMTLNSVPRPAGVSYERSRVWLLCPGCRRSLVLDRPRADRRHERDDP